MVKTTIWFNGNSGRIVAKKRKRMPGTDQSKRKEIKQMNPMYGHPNDYTSFDVVPLLNYTPSLEGGGDIAPWRLHKLLYPSQGTNSYERIGNSIFIKSLRIKGHIGPTWKNIARPISWRLKLYRFDSMYPQVTNHTALNDVGAYLTLFNNFELPSDFSNVSAVYNACRHNFYKAIKKYPKLTNYTCKTIASGILPMTNSLGNFGYEAFGSNPIKTFGSNLADNGTFGSMKQIFPIDINVKINDRITWERDQANTGMTANVFYFLVWEDDFGCGCDVKPSTYNASSGTFNLPYYEINGTNTAQRCYYCNFFAKWYYTDD